MRRENLNPTEVAQSRRRFQPAPLARKAVPGFKTSSWGHLPIAHGLPKLFSCETSLACSLGGFSLFFSSLLSQPPPPSLLKQRPSQRHPPLQQAKSKREKKEGPAFSRCFVLSHQASRAHPTLPLSCREKGAKGCCPRSRQSRQIQSAHRYSGPRSQLRHSSPAFQCLPRCHSAPRDGGRRCRPPAGPPPGSVSRACSRS